MLAYYVWVHKLDSNTTKKRKNKRRQDEEEERVEWRVRVRWQKGKKEEGEGGQWKERKEEDVTDGQNKNDISVMSYLKIRLNNDFDKASPNQ